MDLRKFLSSTTTKGCLLIFLQKSRTLRAILPPITMDLKELFITQPWASILLGWGQCQKLAKKCSSFRSGPLRHIQTTAAKSIIWETRGLISSSKVYLRYFNRKITSIHLTTSLKVKDLPLQLIRCRSLILTSQWTNVRNRTRLMTSPITFKRVDGGRTLVWQRMITLWIKSVQE